MNHHGVLVIDSFGTPTDPAMPFLRTALDPASAAKAISSCVGSQAISEVGQAFLGGVLTRIEVKRHKPGRRCLIEYQFLTSNGTVALLGKVRAKGADHRTFKVVRGLRDAGFDETSEDGISIPAPISIIPEFHMWLQVRAPGQPATALIGEAGQDILARRIAEAAHKLHRTQVPTDRAHSLIDELNILHDRLNMVAAAKPEWHGRLQQLLGNCSRLAEQFPPLDHAGIHRDFYADHVIVDRDRIWLVDFDLYCRGHAALDIGNFSAHLTEQSLRRLGDPVALRDREQALEDRFIELAGEEHRWAVKAYTALTLARHVYISTRFPDRQPFTESLLELAEARVTALLRDRTG
jgi:hypothetical protein